MQSGELTVTGQDYAVIALKGLPSKVEAHFKDHATLIPCNPHHHDELKYDVHTSNQHLSGYVLNISWRVTGVREIFWRIYY